MALMFVMLLFGCTNQQAQQTPAPQGNASNPPEQAVSGQAVFTDNCVGCHGENGEKITGWKAEVREHSLEQVKDVIRNGQGRMPSFSDKLSDEEISAVAEYAKELAAR